MEPKRPKLTPEEKNVQKDCQEAEIAALKQKLVDMEAKLMRVTAELEQVKNERAYDKINFETEKCELESKIGKYKEQCSELQSENKTLLRYLQDLESSNMQSQMNLSNTNFNSRITKVNESNDDALGIDSLPDEMIVEVFRHLSQNQLGQIASVCKKWSLLTKSPVLWRKVDAEILCSSDREKDAESFKSFIDGLPSCVTFIRLDFSGPAGFYMHLDFEKLCMKLNHVCPNLEVLILKRCYISTILPEVINFCTELLQGLKKLVLHSCWFNDYSETLELKDNSNIEVLDLHLSVLPDSSKIQLSKLRSLEELRLAETWVEDAWFVGDASFLNQLQVLDLGRTNITARFFLTIQRHGENLKELYVCKLDLEDYDLNFNGQVFPHLQTICLGRTPVTGEGLVSLLQSCPSLVSVYIDEHVARSFAEHPFVVANRCKSGIVKRIDVDHYHKVDYMHN